MGMFDSVWAKCPRCEEDVEFQSKVGDCVLADYTSDSVPAAIAADIAGDTTICKCGAAVTIGQRGGERVWMPVSAG